MKPEILLVNHDKAELGIWESLLKQWNLPFRPVRDGFTVFQLVEVQKFFAVICRDDLPFFSGGEFARRLKRERPELKLVLAVGKGVPPPPGSVAREYADIGPVVITPASLQEILGRLLVAEGILLGEGGGDYFSCWSEQFPEIVGCSAQIQKVFSLTLKLKNQGVTVLIQGESGTGKELAARAIHRHSRRADQPLISVNCAALPETLLESELFGHEKGAFTGADSRVIGRFEQADGGCLFLDEIGDMSLATQAKVLRVLEGKEFERVGGRERIKVDVRVIAATNKDLKVMVASGGFREDLYYRLAAFPVSMPALRERMEDLPLLVANVLRRFNRDAAGRITAVAPAALEKLLNQFWLGNIRELENVVTRAAILSEGGVIGADHIMVESRPPVVEPSLPAAASPAASPPLSLAEVEREAVRRALARNEMNITRAAAQLGISRATLYKKARDYGIEIAR